MILWLLAGCSLNPVAPSACTSNTECRDAFGFGYACRADGYCATFDVAPGCEVTTPPDLLTAPEWYPDAILLGSMFSGDSDAARSTRLAVAQARGSGGLDEEDLALVQCDLDVAGDAAADFLVDVIGVHAVVGPTGDDAVAAAWERLDGTGVAVVTPDAPGVAYDTLEAVTPTDAEPGLLWRTGAPDVAEGATLAAHLADRADAAVLIAAADARSTALAAAISAAYGGGLATHTFADAGQRTAAVGDVGDLPATTAVAVIAFDPADVAAVLHDAVADGGWDRPIVLSGAGADADALAEVPSLLDRITGTRVMPPGGPVYEAFRTGYAAAYDVEPGAEGGAAQAFDASWLVLYGAAWAFYQEGGAVTGVTIARGMRHVSEGASVQIGPASWSHVVETFAAGEGIDVTGASGPLDVDPSTEEAVPAVQIWHVDGDAIVVSATCVGDVCR